jgi:hypothetical protein
VLGNWRLQNKHGLLVDLTKDEFDAPVLSAATQPAG